MARINLIKKTMAIWTASLLLISLFLTINLTAGPVPNNDDGVWYDDFTDYDSISDAENNSGLSDSKKVTLKNGVIKLDTGSSTAKYKYETDQDNIDAWKIDTALLKPGTGNLGELLGLIINPDIIKIELNTPDSGSTEFSASEYKKIGDRGDDFVTTKSTINTLTDKPFYPVNLFRFKINQNLDIIPNFNIVWYTKDEYDPNSNVEDISMYVWRYNSLLPHWDRLARLSYTEENINDDPSLATDSEPTKNYFSEDGYLDILIIGTPDSEVTEENAYLYSDYIEVNLDYSEGYYTHGEIISPTITPDTSKLKGWEQLIWKGSKSSGGFNISMQILDQNNVLISSLEGNSDGFKTSPVDISGLTGVEKFKIKASFNTNNIQFSPRLYSWGVTWHTRDSFYDSFNSEYRIGDYYGVEIDNGDVKISDSFADWTMLGQNPQNTRAYYGTDIPEVQDNTYWYSELSKNIGGDWHSPIIKDGKVYIGSPENSIYVFNLTAESRGIKQKPYMVNNSCETETSFAIADGNLIFGTSMIDNLTSNKIIALDATNITREKWRYPEGDFSNNICFSAAPTVADDIVFITSWSGDFATNPYMSYLYNYLNNLLGGLLNLNNRVLALDVSSGNPIWNSDVGKLPAGSFCSPAVADGIVIVGCHNFNGSSLFAFDEYTGVEIWNASVGLIGRASPIIVDGKDGKIVIALTREQNLTATKGIDKAVAVDAETGEILWSRQISNQTTLEKYISIVGEFKHNLAVWPPAATPAARGDTVFVMSPNATLFAFDVNTGEIKWTFDAYEGLIRLGLYYSCSPMVVDNTVYVTSQYGDVYSLDAVTGVKGTSYKAEVEDYWPAPTFFSYASPAIVDGLILFSGIKFELGSDPNGALFCLGNYSENNLGKLYSGPIHVQKGKWWDTLKTSRMPLNNSENNSIIISVLDENGNIIIDNLDGVDNDLSNITSNQIQLYAEFNDLKDSEPDPVLSSWEITFQDEGYSPEFNESSFLTDNKGTGGWISNKLEKCSIEVTDRGTSEVTSGIDVDSAEFELEYIPRGASTVTTKKHTAEVQGESGDISVKLIANISKLEIEINDLKNITFFVKDLAKNQANSSKISFKVDNEKPSSEIMYSNDFEDTYNKDVEIEFNGTDDKSGVREIALYYRLKDSDEWSLFDSVQSPFIIKFGINISGIYEFISIATDQAGNPEDLDKSPELEFLYDENKPEIPELDDIYAFNTLPEFNIELVDDYELLNAEYRLEFHGTNEWTLINSEDIDSKTYQAKWTLEEEDWDRLVEDEEYKLFLRISDTAGNIYELDEGDAIIIIKDMKPPVADVNLDLSEFEGGGWKDEYKITAEIPDDSDIEKVTLMYSYSSDNDKWSDWKEYGDEITNAPYEWDFQAKEGSGYYKFKVSTYDKAGNYAESESESVSVTLFPTYLFVLMIILIGVLIIVAFIVIKKFKNKK